MNPPLLFFCSARYRWREELAWLRTRREEAPERAMATITTLGEACDAGWSIRMRCRRGEHRGPAKIDLCQFETNLCLKTLVATRGRDFPLSMVASRLRCPRCGSRTVTVVFMPPPEGDRRRGAA